LVSVLKKALEQRGVEAVSAAWDFAPGQSISEAMEAAIRKADGVVADVTGATPNVMFEVGQAIGLRKPILLLTRERTSSLPFNLRGRQVAVYQPDDLDTVSRYVDLWLRDVIESQSGSESA
jgi:nucleoside 2-deoxyribosyltransferase